MSLRTFDVVAAADERLGIGQRGDLPWRLPGEMKHFRDLTRTCTDPARTNAVVMGRVTWDSIPPRYRPLRGRLNVVLTRDPDLPVPGEVVRAGSLEQALEVLSTPPHAGAIERVFVIGGARVYEQALALPQCARIYLTRVHATFDCDAFFPDPSAAGYRRAHVLREAREQDVSYTIECWERR
jgi:dihydrofolate reductase